MRTKIEDIDQLIKETLTEEETKFYDDLEEPGFFGTVKDLFTGKNSWLMVVMNISQIAAFGLTLYCLIQSFDVEGTNELIIYVAGFFLGFMMMSFIKLLTRLQITKNSLVREIKRLELQVSSLSGKISD